MVGVGGSFCTKPRISVLTYSTPKPICKGRTPDRPIAFGFNLAHSGFDVWDVRNKSKRRRRRRRWVVWDKNRRQTITAAPEEKSESVNAIAAPKGESESVGTIATLEGERVCQRCKKRS